MTGSISSDMYSASVCDVKILNFSIEVLMQFWLFPSITIWLPLTKMIRGKLPGILALCEQGLNFSGCHTLTFWEKGLFFMFYHCFERSEHLEMFPVSSETHQHFKWPLKNSSHPQNVTHWRRTLTNLLFV